MALTLQWHQQIVVLVMIGFPPNSSQFLGHFCPLFVQIARMDLILPNWGLILPRLPPPTWQPLFLTHPSQTPFGDTYIHKTPPIPPQNTPFPGLKLRLGKMNYCLGKMDPNWAKYLKNGQNFLERQCEGPIFQIWYLDKSGLCPGQIHCLHWLRWTLLPLAARLF